MGTGGAVLNTSTEVIPSAVDAEGNTAMNNDPVLFEMLAAVEKRRKRDVVVMALISVVIACAAVVAELWA